MSMALASSPREACAMEGFWESHRRGSPIGCQEDTSHVFSLTKQSLQEKCWAILALMDVEDYRNVHQWSTLILKGDKFRNSLSIGITRRGKLLVRGARVLYLGLRLALESCNLIYPSSKFPL